MESSYNTDCRLTVILKVVIQNTTVSTGNIAFNISYVDCDT